VPPQLHSLSSMASWDHSVVDAPRRQQSGMELPFLNGESSPVLRAASNLSVTFAVEGGGAQETRFGGREAAQMESMVVSGAQTFHPRQDGRRESRYPPGQVPWNTFLWASITIGSVWMLGIGAFVLDPALYIGGHAENSTCAFEVDRATMALQEPQNLLPLLTSEEQLLSSHHWQSRPLPLHALDAACHESYGQRVLIAERFAVHEVRVSKNGSQLPPRRLQDVDLCLAQAPAFHSAGLAGVGLECSESGGCNVLLLAAAATDLSSAAWGGCLFCCWRQCYKVERPGCCRNNSER